METAHQAATRALQTGPNASLAKATPPKPDALADAPRTTVLRRLWTRMAAIYGHRWTSAYGERCDDESGALTIAGDSWQRGLAGVGDAKIGAGLNAALVSADPWPPTLPAFRAMCLGIPGFAAIKAEFRERNTKRSPFLRQVWAYVDPYLFARADVEHAERMLHDAYLLAVEFVMRGGPLPHAAAADIAPPLKPAHVPAPPEVAKRHLDEIAETLGIHDEDDSLAEGRAG